MDLFFNNTLQRSFYTIYIHISQSSIIVENSIHSKNMGIDPQKISFQNQKRQLVSKGIQRSELKKKEQTKQTIVLKSGPLNNQVPPKNGKDQSIPSTNDNNLNIQQAQRVVRPIGIENSVKQTQKVKNALSHVIVDTTLKYGTKCSDILKDQGLTKKTWKQILKNVPFFIIQLVKRLIHQFMTIKQGRQISKTSKFLVRLGSLAINALQVYAQKLIEYQNGFVNHQKLTTLSHKQDMLFRTIQKQLVTLQKQGVNTQLIKGAKYLVELVKLVKPVLQKIYEQQLKEKSKKNHFIQDVRKTLQRICQQQLEKNSSKDNLIEAVGKALQQVYEQQFKEKSIRDHFTQAVREALSRIRQQQLEKNCSKDNFIEAVTKALKQIYEQQFKEKSINDYFKQAVRKINQEVCQQQLKEKSSKDQPDQDHFLQTVREALQKICEQLFRDQPQKRKIIQYLAKSVIFIVEYRGQLGKYALSILQYYGYESWCFLIQFGLTVFCGGFSWNKVWCQLKRLSFPLIGRITGCIVGSFFSIGGAIIGGKIGSWIGKTVHSWWP